MNRSWLRECINKKASNVFFKLIQLGFAVPTEKMFCFAFLNEMMFSCFDVIHLHDAMFFIIHH